MDYTIEQLREIVELAKHKHYGELEEKWLEMTEAPPAELRFFDSTARALLKNEARDRLGDLFSVMASALISKARHTEAVEVIRSAWRYTPNLGDLAATAIEALQALHGDRPNFKRFITASGLTQRTDLFRALERFEQFIYCDEGEAFEHQSFGIGVVESVEPERHCATIRFAGKAPKEFTFEGVRDFLKKIERGSFRAERLRGAEPLKQRAFNAPAEFVRFVLKDHPDGLTQIDFKNLLLDGCFSRDEWEQWWAANRRTIRRDPYIDWGRGGRGVLRLRTQPKTYYEGVIEDFRESDSSTRLALISEVNKHIREEPPPQDFSGNLLDILRTEFQTLSEEEVENVLAGRLERVYLARELAGVFDALTLPAEFDEAALLAQADDPASLILSLSALEFQCRAVETLTAANLTQATQVCARLLPQASPRFAQWLVERLIAQGEIAAVSSAFEQIVRSPGRNPETFLWAARQFFADKYAALSIDVAFHDVIRELAAFLKENQNQIDHGVPNTPTLRGIQMRMKNMLAEDHYEVLRKAVAPLPAAEARGILRLFDGHAAFPDSYLVSLRHAVQESRSDLDETTTTPGVAVLDDAVLYVTLESLKRRQNELQHLRTVEIPKNSREIGEAASLGDLSENAEYEAARHRQRMLFKRAEEMQSEIERARPIDVAWVRTDCVWVGTRIEVRNIETGEIETFAILGAWDSRPEEKVLSYLTPSAAQFLRRRVGERVALPRPDAQPTEYEILKIENALV